MDLTVANHINKLCQTYMLSLDDHKKIQTLDKANMLGTIQDLGRQAEQVARDLGDKEVLPSPKLVKNIVVGGMGGSALGAHVIQALFSGELKAPFYFVNDYRLPAYAVKDSLVIVCSYSGNTEESLSLFNEARKRKARLAVVAGGGRLAALAGQYQVPAYIFQPQYNYCGQPRLALGYALFSLLIMLRNSGYLKVADQEITRGVELLRNMNKKFGVQVSVKNNKAKQWAERLIDKTAVLIGAEFLGGNAHIMANQLNETSKNFAAYFLIPELNHHLLEGLAYPAWLKNKAIFLLFASQFYHHKNQRRMAIMREVLGKINFEFLLYQPSAKTKFLQTLEILSFGSYLSFYLAVLRKLNPSPVPVNDYFKEQLA